MTHLLLILCLHSHHGHYHHRHHHRHHPKPELHQVDTVRIGTPTTVEKIQLTDGRTITVTHRPGTQLP